jgi:hypothetical protein
MNESTVKTDMVKSIRAAGGYARRIEDRYSVGVLDLIMVPKGYPVFFAEVKIVRGLVFKPTDRQYIEMKRINECGGEHMFGIAIGYKDGTYYFSEATNHAEIRDCFSVTTSNMDFPRQLIQFYHSRLKNGRLGN